MEMEAAASAAMDFNTLSRRELQALCKLNGVRANMTNVAMAEALLSLPSVDGIDMNGLTLCLPTPGKSAMKSAMRAASAAAVGDDQQQHGSPLPRGRRVSVKSPAAIRMDVEDGEDEMKRDLIKEIVRTPGVALRSTSRRARATPAPIPTPAAGTLRRSQRSTARKAAAPVEVEVSTTKRTTRTARSKVMIDLDQEEEIAAASVEEKVQEVEAKGVAADEKYDDPEEEEVTKPLGEGNSKAEEAEQGEEVASSVVPIASAVALDRNCDDSKVEEAVVVLEEAAEPQEVAAIGEEQEIVSAEKSAPLPAMEDSPILGVLSKAEATETAIKNIEEASTGNGECLGIWSPVLEITEEINSAREDKEVAAVEVTKEAVKEDALNEEKEVTADEMPQADLKEDESTKEYELDEESSEASDIDEESSEASDIDEESSEEDDLDEEEGDMQKADLKVHAATREIDCTSETDEEGDETIEESDSTNVNFDSDEVEEEVLEMVETGEETDEDEESDSIGEEDDFSADLSAEFDNIGNFSDAETELHASAAASSAAKTIVKSLDDSAITEELEASSEEGEVSQQAAITEEKIDTIVKSLDEFTITQEVTEKKKESEAAGGKAEKKQNLQEKSLRKLTRMYKESLIAKKEGKRLALAELDDNTSVDC